MTETYQENIHTFSTYMVLILFRTILRHFLVYLTIRREAVSVCMCQVECSTSAF